MKEVEKVENIVFKGITYVTLRDAAIANGNITERGVLYNVVQGKFKSIPNSVGIGKGKYLVDLEAVKKYESRLTQNTATSTLVEGFLTVDKSFEFIKLVKHNYDLDSILEKLKIKKYNIEAAQKYYNRLKMRYGA